MTEATEEQMYKFTVEIVFDLWNRCVYQSKQTDRLQAELDEVKADRDFMRKACEDRDKLATKLDDMKAERNIFASELAALKEEKQAPRPDDEPAGKLYAAWCSFWSVWQNNKSLGVATRMTIDNWIGYEVENLRKAIEAAPTFDHLRPPLPAQPVADAVREAWSNFKLLFRSSRTCDEGDAFDTLGRAIESAPVQPVTDSVRAAWVPLDQLIRGSRFEDHGSLLTSCGAFIRFKAAIKSLLGPAKETT